jgi:hypothetical protein
VGVGNLPASPFRDAAFGASQRCAHGSELVVIVTGIVLLLIGVLLGIPILYSLGVLLLIIGIVLYVLGSMGRAIGPRRHYW